MESDLSKRLRAFVFDEVPWKRKPFYRRIEDASGNLGTHDVAMIVDGLPIWAELKETETPGEKPDVRPGQAAFGRMVRRAGGLSVMLVANKRNDEVRVLRGDCRGPDWRECLIHEGPLDLTLWDAILHGGGYME